MGQTSLARRKKMLQKVATSGVSLDKVYAQTLQQVRGQSGDRARVGMEVLMWISHAERPLRIDELRHALAVEIDSPDLDAENIPPQDTVIGSCLGLAVVDVDTSTVRPLHHTLQEYLALPGIMPDAHKTLGHKCLTYLNCQQIRGLPPNTSLNPGDMPFLEYASLYWGCHAKIGLSDRAKSMALELLNQVGNHISVTLLLKKIQSSHACSLPHHLWPGLHYASYFGIVEVVAALVESEGCDINQRDCLGLTALDWATGEGHSGVIILLSQNKVKPNKLYRNGETPLSFSLLNPVIYL